MSVLPVRYTVPAPQGVALLVQEKYKLKAAAEGRLLKAGVNHSYLITAGNDRFVFRIYCYQWRSRIEVEEEIRLLLLLKDNQLPVSYALADAAGQYIQEIDMPEGLRYGVLFSFAPGEKLINYSLAQHRQAGQLMARLHNVTEHLELQRTTYTQAVMLTEPMQYLRDFLRSDMTSLAFMEAALPVLQQYWEQAQQATLRRGVVHLDIWFDNIAIEGDQVTLFDFDFCGNGWLCLDVAYYVLQLYSTEREEAVRTEKLDAFLAGYESVTPLHEDEKRLLPALGVMLYYFYLGNVQCRRFEDWSSTFFNPTYLQRFVQVFIKPAFERTGSKLEIQS